MKIAHVCPYNYFRFGGVQIHIHDLVNELNKQGIDSWVIAPDNPQQDRQQCYQNKVFLIGKQIAFSIDKTESDLTWCNQQQRQKLKQFLQQQRFDLIHFHTPWNPFLSWQLLALFKGHKVATFHNTPGNGLSGRFLSFLFRALSPWFLQYFHGLITVSASSKAHLRLPRNKSIKILPPCFHLPPQARQRFDAEAGFSENKDNSTKNDFIHICYLGRLEKRKGVLYLLTAFAQLQKHYPQLQLKLTIAGSGVDENIIKAEIQQKNIRQVRLTGKISQQEKQNLLMQADIFCAPATEGESFGMVLVEAMNQGVPVVAFDNPGYRQVLKEQRQYCLAESGNIDDLVNKLAFLIEHPDIRQKLSQWGRQQAQQYDCKNQLSHFIQLYQQVINETL